jgi:hypothetical protein
MTSPRRVEAPVSMRPEDVRALARGGAMLLAAGVALRLLESIFASRPILPVVIGAFALDAWSRRLGVRWMPTPAPESRSQVFRRWVARVGIGLGIGLFVVAGSAIGGAARVGFGTASATSMAIGAVRIAAHAFRDELLYRGIPLALAEGHVPRSWSIAFCTVFGVAPLMLSSGGRLELLVLGAAAAVFFALSWQVGPGGFAAWASHTGWLFAIEVVARGAPLDVTWSLSSTTEASGVPAYIGAAAFGLAAFILYGRKARRATVT